MDPQALNIVIGVVLAFAAMFAFLIQRARYLREIEPDLELFWPDSIRVEQMSNTLKEFWAFYIDVAVRNRSNNHAYDLLCEVELKIFPHRGKATYIPAHLPQRPRLHTPDLLRERSDVIQAYCGWNYALGLYDQLQAWPDPLNVEDAGLHATVVVRYFSRREGLLFVLSPWNWGREKYERRVSGYWGFVSDKRASTQYLSKPWRFPDKSLGTTNNKTPDTPAAE